MYQGFFYSEGRGRVLVMCTEQYVAKAMMIPKGGVGYESLIINGSNYSNRY